NTSVLASSRVRYVLRAVRSVFNDEKKLSIAALSQTLPERLIEQTTPIGHQLLELLAGVLAATVGMMQQRIGFTPSPDRHHQGIGDELRCHRSPHRPADNAPGEEIDNSSHIQPTLRCPHIREGSNPFAIGSRRGEAALEHVRSDGGRRPLTQIERQAPPPRKS